jgi:hypothetical protein
MVILEPISHEDKGHGGSDNEGDGNEHDEVTRQQLPQADDGGAHGYSNGAPGCASSVFIGTVIRPLRE